MGQMKTGDACAEFWLEAAGGRSYCVEVSSKRKGGVARYSVAVEFWWSDPKRPGADGDKWRVVRVVENIETFTEAMRLGRRIADRQEHLESRR